MDYQDTPGASKNNAFCWRTYEPTIQWKSGAGQFTGDQKRAATVDAKRAAGVDPLFFPGLASAGRQNPLDPKRFAMATIERARR
ncbi:MAG: hypothetical protein K0R58_26 [Ramlibacter sp.]|jgi:hypothetical protein|nr:hypothetical protein [Ramlibacter sp.]